MAYNRSSLISPESLFDQLSQNDVIRNSEFSLLLNLPNEVLLAISAQASEKDATQIMGKLSRTCSSLHALFQPELDKNLLELVLKGEQVKAEKMIAANPKLLFIKAKAKDYSGRTIEGTALQIALGAEDVGYHEDEECMVEMIQRYLRQLPNGEEEITKQIREQFPEGYERQEKERAEKDSEALKKVVDAISISQPNDDCEVALQAFRDYLEFENKGKGVIRTGKHFNIQLLVDAFKLYDNDYDRFGGWDSHKNNLFWRKVIGYIQRFLPACYAQAFCQGIYYIVEGGEKLKRSLKFRFADASYFPLGSDPRFRLGSDLPAPARGGGGWRFTNYVRQKTSTLRELTQRPDNHSKSRCAVM